MRLSLNNMFRYYYCIFYIIFRNQTLGLPTDLTKSSEKKLKAPVLNTNNLLYMSNLTMDTRVHYTIIYKCSLLIVLFCNLLLYISL